MAIRAIRRTERVFEVTASAHLTFADVERIEAALDRLPAGAIVRVDLRDVHVCEPPALLALSRALAASGAPCELVGITASDERLLRYLAPPADLGAVSHGA